MVCNCSVCFAAQHAVARTGVDVVQDRTPRLVETIANTLETSFHRAIVNGGIFTTTHIQLQKVLRFTVEAKKGSRAFETNIATATRQR